MRAQLIIGAIAGVLSFAVCAEGTGTGETAHARELPADDHDATPLHALADFPVGVAVPADPWDNSLLGSPERQAIVERHFDSITAENAMKMAYLHPSPDYYEFSHADALVDYAQSNGLIVHGHALVWHDQAPDWMNELEASGEEFRNVLEDHVVTVAGHFVGRVRSWDVVNEAFDDEDDTGYRQTIWFEAIGPGYIELAFRAARAADPTTDLYYNDYNISGSNGPGKLDRVLEMVDDFQARGVPIDGIGFQMHIGMDSPDIQAVRRAFTRVVERGLKVRISELDVSVNDGEQYEALSQDTAEKQAARYAAVVRVYKDTVPPNLRGGITVWGITDGDSWIPGFRNRADWPLLFNADFSPKPALTGFAHGLSNQTAAEPAED